MSEKPSDKAGASDPSQEQAESAYEGRRPPADEVPPTGVGAGPTADQGTGPDGQAPEGNRDSKP
jgi:hypothetical protein